MKISLEFNSIEEMREFVKKESIEIQNDEQKKLNVLQAAMGDFVEPKSIKDIKEEMYVSDESTPIKEEAVPYVPVEEVRKKLTELNKRVKGRAQELVKGMGYDKFSDIPVGSHDMFMLDKYAQEELNA